MAHVPDQELVAECARLAERIVELESRIEALTDRAAHSRDSVVRMRDRLRSIREERRALKDLLAEANALQDRNTLISTSFADGYETAMKVLTREMLSALQDRSADLGAAGALLEIRREMGDTDEPVREPDDIVMKFMDEPKTDQQ